MSVITLTPEQTALVKEWQALSEYDRVLVDRMLFGQTSTIPGCAVGFSKALAILRSFVPSQAESARKFFCDNCKHEARGGSFDSRGRLECDPCRAKRVADEAKCKKCGDRGGYYVYIRNSTDDTAFVPCSDCKSPGGEK